MTDLHPGLTDDAPTLDQMWARVMDGLSDGALSPQQRAYIGLTRPLGLVEDTALVSAPN